MLLVLETEDHTVLATILVLKGVLVILRVHIHSLLMFGLVEVEEERETVHGQYRLADLPEMVV